MANVGWLQPLLQRVKDVSVLEGGRYGSGMSTFATRTMVEEERVVRKGWDGG